MINNTLAEPTCRATVLEEEEFTNCSSPSENLQHHTDNLFIIQITKRQQVILNFTVQKWLKLKILTDRCAVRRRKRSYRARFFERNG